MANLAGLYAKSKTMVDVPDWPYPFWQPIPVHTLSLEQDTVRQNLAYCILFSLMSVL